MFWFRPTRGFSIVEALVALLLLAFGIYSAADVISSARANAMRTERSIQATGLAQLKLEELRLAGPELASLMERSTTTTLNLPGTSPGVFDQNAQYHWRAVVQPLETDQTTGSLRIHVHVSRAGGKAPDGEAIGIYMPLSGSGGIIL